MGHGQHTMVSCDDGLTWKQNKYTNEIVVGSDTDHIPFGLRGSAYANGAFYAMWGWGTNTYIERSTDGVNWQAIFGVADPNARSSTTYDPAFRYWGWGLLALDDGRVLFANDADIHLLNSGATAWTHITLATAFNKPILGYANGTFVMHPEGGGYYTSADGQGLTQWAPAITVPNECKGGRTSKILFNNAVLALPAADMNGEYVCSSMDAGQTWRSKKVSQTFGRTLA